MLTSSVLGIHPSSNLQGDSRFVSGTPGKEPKKVKDASSRQTDLKDGKSSDPTQPSQTEVKTSEGTWSFKSYDKTSDTINGADVSFVGTWEFTPAPTTRQHTSLLVELQEKSFQKK